MMDRQSVADRIVVYCDTIVALSLVNGLAFLIALGEPDIRCSIARISLFIGAINLIFPSLSTVALVWLRRFELRLRESQDEDDLIAGFWRVIVPLRMCLVWVFSAMVLVGIFAATFDETCFVAMQ